MNINNKQLPKRKNLRIKNYDYSQEGIYFITICTHNRKCILSKINTYDTSNKIESIPYSPTTHYSESVGAGFHARPQNVEHLPIGIEIVKTIEYINAHYKNAKIKEYVIMPNHVHMLIEIMNHNGRAWKPAPT